MTLTSKAALRGLAAAAALALGSIGAQAGTWDYTQSFGAETISARFSGTDSNGDLAIDASEATFESLTYSGTLGNLAFGTADILVADFSWATGELGAQGPSTNPSNVLTLWGTPASGSGLGVYWSTGVNVGYVNDGSGTAGELFVFDVNDSNISTQFGTTNVASVAVTAVPEPESYLMMAIGLAGIAAAKRRKKI